MAIRSRTSGSTASGGSGSAPLSAGKGPKKLILPPPKRIARGLPAAPDFMRSGEIGTVVSGLQKKFGAPVVRVASERIVTSRLRSGVFILDLALGGGFVEGRTHMIYGEKSSGKTTLVCRIIAAIQQMYPDQVVVVNDIEGTFDVTWAEKNGVDLSRLLILEPESGEHAIDIADGVIRTAECAAVINDSIAMLTPMKEIANSAEDVLPGLHARLIGNFLRRTNQAQLAERHRGHKPTIFHINQFRMKIGQMFGDPRTLPGGKALEFVTSQQVLMKNTEHKHEKAPYTGYVDYNEHSFTISKDKTGGRIKEGAFKLIRDADIMQLPEAYIDQTGTVMTWGERAGLVEAAGGGNYNIEGHGRLRGLPAVRDYFMERPDAFTALQDDIIEYFRQRWNVS